MMKTLASRSFDKQKRIFDIELENSKLKSEVRSLEGKTPHLIRNKIDREKKEIERELNICVKTDPSHKLQKVLEILSIFGINVHDEIDSSSSKKINGSPNNKLVGHLKKDSTSSEPFNYKQRAIDYENLESFENVVKESTNSKANETSESCNCEEVDIKEYALSIDGNEESFEQIERDKLGLNQPHQICNIQINELRKYIKQIEEENQAIEKRLEEQIIINQELEKKNILLNSNFVNKTDEVEILKKCMNENKEITKDLKTILSGVSNSFDMYHTLYNEKALSSSCQGLRFNPYNTSQSNYGKNSSQNFNNMKKEQRIPLDKRAKSLSKALQDLHIDILENRGTSNFNDCYDYCNNQSPKISKESEKASESLFNNDFQRDSECEIYQMKFSKMSINQRNVIDEKGRPPIPTHQNNGTCSSGSSSNIMNFNSSPVIKRYKTGNQNITRSLNSSIEKSRDKMAKKFNFE